MGAGEGKEGEGGTRRGRLGLCPSLLSLPTLGVPLSELSSLPNLSSPLSLLKDSKGVSSEAPELLSPKSELLSPKSELLKVRELPNFSSPLKVRELPNFSSPWCGAPSSMKYRLE